MRATYFTKPLIDPPCFDYCGTLWLTLARWAKRQGTKATNRAARIITRQCYDVTSCMIKHKQ